MGAIKVLSSFSPRTLMGTVDWKHSRTCFQLKKSERQSIVCKHALWRRTQVCFGCNSSLDIDALAQTLGHKKVLPHAALNNLGEMNSEDLPVGNHASSELMHYYVDDGFCSGAEAIWDDCLNNSVLPNIPVLSILIESYGRRKLITGVTRILHEVRTKRPDWLPEIYSAAICCFGEIGQLEMMETILREMVSMGFSLDAGTGNAVVIYYSIFGTLTEMEAAYERLKRSRVLIEKDGIRAMSFAYIKEKKFYDLGEFVRGVGLGRRNVGNLLWNLLLLSYAANFKMKSLQREFLEMVESGFRPDLTTFNIRAVAFSKMALLWDLHLSLDHMKYEEIVPDLVTYGCVVDAYLDRRLGMNLDFALSKMQANAFPNVSTDPFVFEVLGKGDFHASSEAFLEFKRWEGWTYKKLIATYLKKKYRSNQIFWNY